MPLPTTNLTGHFDASDTDRLWKERAMSTHPADGEEVVMWDDEGDATGNCFGDGAAGAGTFPLYRAGGAIFNGQGNLDFGTGTLLRFVDDGWTAFQNDSTLIAVSAFTVFVAFILEGDATNDGTFYLNTAVIASSSGYWGLYFTTITGVHTAYAYNFDGSIVSTGVTISKNVKYVAMIKHASGAISIDVNDGALTNSASSGDTAGASEVKVATGAGTPTFVGRIGEIAIYNASVTGTDLSDAWAYFMAKWVNAAAGTILTKMMQDYYL